MTLLLPLAVGMLVLSNFPKHAGLISKWSIRASLLGILLIVRNVNLRVLIKTSMFPAIAGANSIGDMILFTLLLYAGLQMLVAAGIINLASLSL